MVLDPHSYAMQKIVEHHHDFGDDDLIAVLSHAMAGGHTDHEHLNSFADDLHEAGYPHTAKIARAVALAAKSTSQRRV